MSRMRREGDLALGILGVAVAALASCVVNPDLSGTQFRCSNAVCPDGYVCNAQAICVRETFFDAALPDPDAVVLVPDASTNGFKSDIVVGEVGAVLSNFPLRVHLDTTRIDFASTRPGGADLFFTDASGTILSHEIERWSPPVAEVWVLVPQLTDGTVISLHFGTNGMSNTESVWEEYRAVWHLGETLNTTVCNAAITDTGTVSTPGFIGSARNFSAGYLDFGSCDLLENSSQATVSAWIRQDGGPCVGNCAIVGASVAVGTPNKSRVGLETINTAGPNLIIRHDDSLETAFTTSDPVPTTLGAWTHVVGTADLAADRMVLYVDGALVSIREGIGLTGTFDAPASLKVAIGIDEGLLDGAFPGAIDEVRVQLVAQTSTWIAAQFRSQSDTLLSFGAVTPK